MNLRDYQDNIVNANLQAAAEGCQSTLTGVFTGGGKTVMFVELANRIGGRALIIPPLRELVWQAVDKVREIIGTDPGLEMAEYRSEEDEWWSPNVVVGCKQTLLRGRYKKFQDIRLVIVDEAHLQFSPACLEMFRWFNERGAMVAGFTATPFRMDGTPMRDYYQREVCNLDVQWAIANGWAVPPVCKLARVHDLDLSEVSISGGDFNQTQLQHAVEKEANLHRIALITQEEMEGPTVVFTPSVASAKGVCHYLTNNYGIPAVYVYGTQPEDERKAAIRSFKDGQAKVLVNCQVVAVGFDFPPTATLILGRPTKSRSFWLQCVGRATRPLPGVVDYEGSDPSGRIARIAASGKPRFKIVDCTDASLDHRLVTAVDMFCTADKDVRQAVKKAAAAAEEPLSPEEIDALAQQELERRLLAQEIEARRKRMTGKASGRLFSEEVQIGSGQRCVGTYMNPLKGKFAGRTLNTLPDWYLRWASVNTRGWVSTLFRKERERRRGKQTA